MTPVYLQQLRGKGREREREKERKERRVIHLCAERVLVQGDEVALPCLLHQICHLLPPLCLIFLLSSYSNASKGEKHRARAKRASCELPKRDEQRGTKQERKGRKNDYSAAEIHLFLVQKNWTGRISRENRFCQ
jgi:hypothetical protein